MSMSDPVAARASGMIDHMNKDHEESMIAIVMHHNKQLTHPPLKARMTSLDSKGFTIEYRYVTELVWNTKGNPKWERVDFTPHIKDPNEVRARLVKMSQEAEASVPKTYPITYSMPRELPPSIAIFVALYLMVNPSTLASLPLPVINALAGVRDKIGGIGVVSVIWKGLVAAHAAETVALAVYLFFYRGASLVTTAKWLATHFFVGFPNYFAFKKLNPDVPSPSKKH